LRFLSKSRIFSWIVWRFHGSNVLAEFAVTFGTEGQLRVNLLLLNTKGTKSGGGKVNIVAGKVRVCSFFLPAGIFIC
jgi:hypothetical protein